MLISHALNFKKSKPIQYIASNSTLEEAVKMLAENNIGAMPVSDDGMLIKGYHFRERYSESYFKRQR